MDNAENVLYDLISKIIEENKSFDKINIFVAETSGCTSADPYDVRIDGHYQTVNSIAVQNHMISKFGENGIRIEFHHAVENSVYNRRYRTYSIYYGGYIVKCKLTKNVSNKFRCIIL